MRTAKIVVALKSGSKFEFCEPPFDDASALLETLAAELLKVNVDLGNISDYISSQDDVSELSSQDDVSELLKDAKIANTFKNAVCQLVSSKAFKSALFVCAERSLLNGEKIVPSSFEQYRGDYLPVCWEVAKLTLTPFIASLNLSSSTKLPDPQSSRG
jgi:hypothetical protein